MQCSTVEQRQMRWKGRGQASDGPGTTKANNRTAPEHLKPRLWNHQCREGGNSRLPPGARIPPLVHPPGIAKPRRTDRFHRSTEQVRSVDHPGLKSAGLPSPQSKTQEGEIGYRLANVGADGHRGQNTQGLGRAGRRGQTPEARTGKLLPHFIICR